MVAGAGVRRPLACLAMDRAILQRLPKVVLHDHLDGGLRPATILDLAEGAGLSRGCPRPTPPR